MRWANAAHDARWDSVGLSCAQDAAEADTLPSGSGCAKALEATKLEAAKASAAPLAPSAMRIQEGCAIGLIVSR
jgi:hypothetical protein